RRAEEAGFPFAMISDHYHPWTDRQGNSPFVWGVLGAISQVTERVPIGTAVTCPTIRIHPAIIAQAAATTAQLFKGRFFLGLGTGENLNEHITGQRWPAAPDNIAGFKASGGAAERTDAGLKVSWPKTEAEANRTAREWWPVIAAHGELSQELPLPRTFEQAVKDVTEDQVSQQITCGPDPQMHLDAIRKYADAGYEHVYVHQVGPDQEGFFRFYEHEVLPRLIPASSRS